MQKRNAVEFETGANANREVLDHQILREKYSFNELKSNDALKSSINYCKKYYRPNGDCFINFLLNRFPFFRWIVSYDVKQNLVKDIISGLTIGNLYLIHIP